MQPANLRANPGLPVWAGLGATLLAGTGVLTGSTGWPGLCACLGLLGWTATVALAPGARSGLVQLLCLGFAATGLSLGAGGPTNAAFAAQAWPILGAIAGGVSAWRGVVVAVAGSVAAALAGLVLARSGIVLVTPEWGAIVGLGGMVLLGIAAFASTMGIGARAPGTAVMAQAPADSSLVDRSLALEALHEADAARREAAGRARFMAEMSHELRTPLNAIIGFSDSMKEGVFGPLPERYADYAGLIHQSGKHLLELISDLLDLSKVEAGRYRIEAGPVDLAQIAAEAVMMGTAVAGPQDVHLRLEAAGPVTATGDRRAVLQMLLNLVSNAVKFTPAGGLVTVRALTLSDGPRLEVQDTGVGMTVDQLARIGQPYASSTDGLSGQRGTGLGLALVQRLAALQGGSLAIDSQPGAGTLAVVKLPVAQALPEASPEATPETSPETSPETAPDGPPAPAR